MNHPCFRQLNDPSRPSATCYWMTHAGGGTNTLAHRIRTDVADSTITIRSPWMPAREQLADVSFDGDLNELAQILGDQIIADRESESVPFVLIGHSFGSVLAYRIVAHLVSKDVMPHRLVALSFPAPDRLSHEQQLHLLSDEELIEQVDLLFGGVPEGIRNDIDAQKFFVPGLRFDLGLLEGYEHQDEHQRLSIPITAICGTDDRAVDMAQMQRWQRMTSAPFRLRAMPGDHFFPLARIPEIMRVAVA